MPRTPAVECALKLEYGMREVPIASKLASNGPKNGGGAHSPEKGDGDSSDVNSVEGLLFSREID